MTAKSSKSAMLADVAFPNTESLRTQFLAAASLFGYQQWDVPVVENSDIYLLKSGEGYASQLCDVVARKRLSLRPEHTATFVRIVAAQHGASQNPLRFSYVGPVFRQREGYAEPRQLLEAGVELFGLGGWAGEVELLSLITQYLNELQLASFQARLGHVGIIQGYLDSLGLDRRLSSFLLEHREVIREEGSAAVLELMRDRLPEFSELARTPKERDERKQLRGLLAPLGDEEARQVLREFLSLTQWVAAENGPDEDDVDRLLTKLRRVDSTAQLRQAIAFIEELVQLVGEPKPVIAEARLLLERYEQEDSELNELETLLTHTAALGQPPMSGWLLDLGLSRGLHYYSGLIFEIFSGEGNESQRWGGGGRYDGLTELFGGQPTPACGFSLSLTRLAQAQMREGGRALHQVEPLPIVIAMDDWCDALPWLAKMRAAGCAVSMMPEQSETMGECIVWGGDSSTPQFRWVVDGAPMQTLNWDETLARLLSRGERAAGDHG